MSGKHTQVLEYALLLHSSWLLLALLACKFPCHLLGPFAMPSNRFHHFHLISLRVS